MRIVHILSYFKPDLAYQENYLTVGQRELGHEVFIITSKFEPYFQINKGKRTHELGEFDYRGVKILRIRSLYEIKNRFIVFVNLLKHLRAIQPDMIFFHDHSPELLNCIRYVKKNPNTKLVIDIHSSFDNSMKSTFGPLYHKVLWRSIVKRIQKYYHKVFYVAPECRDFAIQVYGIDEGKLELLPLPGDASLIKNFTLYMNVRRRIREELGVSDSDRVIFHTGKLPGDKKTLEVLAAFQQIEDPSFKLFIVGSVENGFRDILNKYIERDNRIIYLGWKNASKLKELLVGGDLLLQPGSLSNTFIEAICAGIPLVLADTPQGRYLTKNGNGYLLDEISPESIKDGILHVLEKSNFQDYRERSIMASEEYHYINIAKKSVQ
ncbi:hypothetical protein AT15_06270 [Kosmotoga arenicorallina S304]|uniref:Glycosyltransferase subfamily 4-like N-terminal domain-containing protein n=1 Tax=Kosmotoga arenicorallina S304 TaxID=1453497 RepID=A0A176JTS6_9BACT|nr:glycosyltransferase family 4 protein [Kosmotoga arenicorallina]OAA26748.1 hypothetical protein AT15_06270 [Kosmotoga arenicorallina S304]